MRPFITKLCVQGVLQQYRCAGGFFSSVPQGEPDSILGLSQDFRKDSHPKKVNLAVGVYRDDNNNSYILKSVEKASQMWNMEYANINGIQEFIDVSQKLCFGNDCAALRDRRVASCQTLGGTGALRIGGEMLHRFVNSCDVVYSPDPGYANHRAIFKQAGINIEDYTYYNPVTKGLNLAGMLESLEKLPERSVVLLHACAHNPTGVDPTHEEWLQVIDVLKRRNHLPFIDMAYQGFATGDHDYDAFLPRELEKALPNLIVAQSFSKNFGLYGHRCGAIHCIVENPQEVERVLSQYAIIIRPMYSNPPLYGANIVRTILTSETLKAEWEEELKIMSGRLSSVRQDFVRELKNLGSQLDWSHIERQIGMMAYTGLTKDQVIQLRKDYHIYMTLNGRAALPGINKANVEYVARAFYDVTK